MRPVPIIPLADSLFSTLEKLESLVAVHVSDPYNEFFKTRGTLVNLHEPAKRVQNRGLRAMSPFRIVDRDGEMLADAATLDEVTGIVRRAPLGRTMSTRKSGVSSSFRARMMN